MEANSWQLQDAKVDFSQVVAAALRGTPQHVTRRGREAVVVLSEAHFKVLFEATGRTFKPRPHYTLADLLAGSDDLQQISAASREWVDAPAVGGDFARRMGFTVPLISTKTTGVVRCDQPRVLDLTARNGRKIDTLPDDVMDEVLAKVATLFQ